jgi:hypothetical protein
MNDILTLYAPQMLAVITAVAVLLLGANIFQAMKVMVMDADLDGMKKVLETVRQQAQDERDKREQADTLNERMDDEQREHLMNLKKLRQQLYDAEAERDEARAEAMQFAADLNTLQAERANLYRRNDKGHFEAVVKQGPRPHTLKHGMTVKNPSAYQAKRIFADAKKAGLIRGWEGSVNERYPNIYYAKFGANDFVISCIPNGPLSTTYISAREFRRRIKGEIA